MGLQKIFYKKLTSIVVLVLLSVLFLKLSLDTPSVVMNYKIGQPRRIQTATSSFKQNNYKQSDTTTTGHINTPSATTVKDYVTSVNDVRIRSTATTTSSKKVENTTSAVAPKQAQKVTSKQTRTLSPPAFTPGQSRSMPFKNIDIKNRNNLLGANLSSVAARRIGHPNYDDYLNILNKRVVPVDLMKVGPFEFMPNYRNPCWRKSTRGKPGLSDTQCLPYFYLVGAPKSGTTDLFRRLVQHPEIVSNVTKEPHWLTRKRHYAPMQASFGKYLAYFNRAARSIVKTVDKSGYHPLIVGDCSASTLWDNDYWAVSPEFSNLTEPFYTTPDYLHHINPNTKILAILRNPIDRLYSDYLYFTLNTHKGPELFHEDVKVMVRIITKCLTEHTLRYCVNNPVYTLPKRHIRARIGFYHHFLQDYFRVFPREQVLVIKLEDFTHHSDAYMTKIFDFLGLSSVSPEQLQELANNDTHANSRRPKDKTIGAMLPETRKLLQEFYKFHNDQLGSLLGEQFNYNNDEVIVQ